MSHFQKLNTRFFESLRSTLKVIDALLKYYSSTLIYLALGLVMLFAFAFAATAVVLYLSAVVLLGSPEYSFSLLEFIKFVLYSIAGWYVGITLYHMLQKSVETQNEEMETEEMDDKEDEKIINDYGKIMGKSAYMVFGAPISMLPYSKDEIKEAIKMAILWSKPGDDISHLIAGYTDLSTYTDDKKACISILAINAIKEKAEGKDKTRDDKTNKNYELMCDWCIAESIKIHEEILQDHKKLLKELDPTLDFVFGKGKK